MKGFSPFGGAGEVCPSGLARLSFQRNTRTSIDHHAMLTVPAPTFYLWGMILPPRLTTLNANYLGMICLFR